MIYDYNPDYKKAEQLAYETLIDYSDGEIPINIKNIIKKHENITLMSYSKFQKIFQLTFDEIVDIYGSGHGFTIYDLKKDIYLIAYNNLDDPATIRWTIAHELGHVKQEHLKRTDYNLIHYNNGEHPMEKEANTYAKHILAPFPLIAKIKEYNKGFNIVKPDEISTIFDINFMPSVFICEHISKLYYYPRNTILELKFYQSITNLKVGPFRDFDPNLF
ncbi:hypothetical protein PSAG_01375 [Fusobacterium animalis D11]|uniref:IrrE N-terminal-like domain-containing protein n=1 Tax=Fusobacterium animalis D11 TaxID=556264 RepID=D6BGP3_9FUSO|nr:ImmA/IrrE family metallo-endopeptidase [Fusobacterium nucleatum]EFD81340.1 hypothetical protein PSAG_01375 [Fusobacterium animalis D11]